MKKVFIGVGHGGADCGAYANGIKESDANLVMALEMKRELEKAGVSVGISRIRDENDPLSEEIQEANAFSPDLAIDVHNNAGGGDGFEVFKQTNKFSSVSASLAKNIEAEVIKIGQNSRGVKTKLNSSNTDWFGFLRQIRAPAVLCEGAFLDSKDHEAIDTVAEQQQFGKAYAKAVLKTLGIETAEKPAPAPMPPQEQTKKLYKVQVGAFTVKANADTLVAKLKAAGFKDAYIKQE